MGKNETAPKTGMVLQVEAIDIFLIFSYCFPRVLHLAWVTVTIGSMRRYLDPTEVTQAVQLLRDGPSICAVARSLAVSPSTVSRAWRRFQETVNLGELDRVLNPSAGPVSAPLCKEGQDECYGSQEQNTQAD